MGVWSMSRPSASSTARDDGRRHREDAALAHPLHAQRIERRSAIYGAGSSISGISVALQQILAEIRGHRLRRHRRSPSIRTTRCRCRAPRRRRTCRRRSWGLSTRPQSCTSTRLRTVTRAGLDIHLHFGDRAAVGVGHGVDHHMLGRREARRDCRRGESRGPAGTRARDLAQRDSSSRAAAPAPRRPTVSRSGGRDLEQMRRRSRAPCPAPPAPPVRRRAGHHRLPAVEPPMPSAIAAVSPVVTASCSARRRAPRRRSAPAWSWCPAPSRRRPYRRCTLPDGPMRTRAASNGPRPVPLTKFARPMPRWRPARRAARWRAGKFAPARAGQRYLLAARVVAAVEHDRDARRAR